MADETDSVAEFKKDMEKLFSPEEASELAGYAAEGVADYKETGDPSSLFGLKQMGATQEAVDAAISMGAQLVRQGLLQQAAEWFTGLIQLEPMNAKVYFWSGLVAHKLKLYLNAITAYRLARAIDPDDANVQLYIGECYLLTNNLEAGFEALRIGIELSKNKPELAPMRLRAERFLAIGEKLKSMPALPQAAAPAQPLPGKK